MICADTFGITQMFTVTRGVGLGKEIGAWDLFVKVPRHHALRSHLPTLTSVIFNAMSKRKASDLEGSAAGSSKEA